MFIGVLVEFITLSFSIAAYLLVMGMVVGFLELPVVCAAFDVAPSLVAKVDKVTPGYRAILYSL